MNWGKKLKAWLIGRGINAGRLGLVEAKLRHRTAQEAIVWQRNQLRTDESVERVAESMFIMSQACYEYQDRTDWHELHKTNQDVYRADARLAIRALLGEQP